MCSDISEQAFKKGSRGIGSFLRNVALESILGRPRIIRNTDRSPLRGALRCTTGAAETKVQGLNELLDGIKENFWKKGIPGGNPEGFQ